MKVIFVLDDQSIYVSSVEEIQLRQLNEGLAGLAIPAGKNDQGEDLFRPLITYPVNLTVARPKAVQAAPMPIPNPTPALALPAPTATAKRAATKKAQADDAEAVPLGVGN